MPLCAEKSEMLRKGTSNTLSLLPVHTEGSNGYRAAIIEQVLLSKGPWDLNVPSLGTFFSIVPGV